MTRSLLPPALAAAAFIAAGVGSAPAAAMDGLSGLPGLVAAGDSVRRDRSDGEMVSDWRWAPLGATIGRGGLWSADLDGDDEVDLVLTGGGAGFSPGRRWYVLEHDGHGLVFRYVSAPRTDWEPKVLRLESADGGTDIVVVSAGGVGIHDGKTLVEIAGFAIAPAEPTAAATVDRDGDGAQELVVLDEQDLYVYDLTTGALEALLPGFGGWTVAVGEVDGDPAPELAVAAGYGPGRVLDAGTLEVQWLHPPGFGFDVDLADVGGDPWDEVILGRGARTGIEARDLPDGVESWRFEIDHVQTVTVADVTGDGHAEILVGETGHGRVWTLDAATGSVLGSLANPLSGVTSLAAADLDRDGSIEVVFGAGSGSSAADQLLVAASPSGPVEWASRDIGGPFWGLDIGDADADGDPDLLVSYFESGSGYSGGGYLIFDARSGELWAAPDLGYWEVSSARFAQADSDPQLEVCLTFDAGSVGAVQCRDALTAQLQWGLLLPTDLGATSLLVRDVDADGDSEVVVGTDPGPFVYAFDLTTGWLDWRSPPITFDLPGAATVLTTAQLDDDAPLEVFATVARGGAASCDGGTGLSEATWPWSQVEVVQAYDLDFDGRAEAIVGDDLGRLSIVDASTGAELREVLDLPSRIRGSTLAFVGPGPAIDAVLVSGGVVRAVDLQSGLTLSQGPPLDDTSGDRSSLLVRDLDEDGRLEVVVSAGSGLEILEIPTSNILVDDFELGDLSRWSRRTGLPSAPPAGEGPTSR